MNTAFFAYIYREFPILGINSSHLAYMTFERSSVNQQSYKLYSTSKHIKEKMYSHFII